MQPPSGTARAAKTPRVSKAAGQNPRSLQIRTARARRVANRLARETSTYLLQHAENPVDWYPWGPEALGRARAENKPVFLSVGYSACHWCHVMEHDSFENADIADFMNANFVNIKVDREERPDIDDVYQRACQMATGTGGWPLSVFLTPEQEPFHIGTFYPSSDSYGRPGFGSVLRQMAQAWREDSSGVRKAAGKISANLAVAPAQPSPVSGDMLDEAAVNLLQAGDPVNGGFGSAPKFPSSACVSFLLAYSRDISRFGGFAAKTLSRMGRGGMFDHVGGGFHRYSTDARWLVPHFEKMLYDNALIPVSYADAYRATGDPAFLETISRTLDFMLRELRSEEGGFYSALDADSGNGEGEFYTWTRQEVLGVLGRTPESEAFCAYYDITDGGNWEGRTILCNSIGADKAAARAGISEARMNAVLAEGRDALLKERSRRPRPARDAKIISSWNALAMSALVTGYRLTLDGRYLEAASGCARFMQERMFSGGRLLRIRAGGASKINGYLDDYAFYGCALLDLFEASPSAGALEGARETADAILDGFWDGDTLHMSSEHHEELVAKPSSAHDLSLPSGSSASASLLLRLYHLTREEKYLSACERIMAAHGRQAAENPLAFGNMLNVMLAYLRGVTEISVMDGDGRMSAHAWRRHAPGAIAVRVSSPAQLDALSGVPFFEGKEFGRDPRAYVCKNRSCSAPVGSEAELDALLG